MPFLAKGKCRLPVGSLLRKTLLIMKLTAILLVAACLQVSARGNAQQVTLSEQNSSLQNVFKEIRRQTGYQFFYNTNLLNKARTVSISVRNAPLTSALDQVFANQPLDYRIVDKIIVVREKSELPLVVNEATAFVDVSGKVIDEKGEPLKGVTVENKNNKETPCNWEYSRGIRRPVSSPAAAACAW